MKKYLFLMLVAFTMIGNLTTAVAQTSMVKNRQRLSADQIIQKRTSQMAQTLMLDDKTTTKFAPIYSQYLKDRMSTNKNNKLRVLKRDSVNGMTDEDAENIIQNKFAQSRKLLDIQEKYYNQFRKILTPKQILKIYQSEKTTHQRLRQEMNNRMMRQGSAKSNQLRSRQKMMQQQNVQQNAQQN